jgi:hypothetical protein
MTKVDIYLHSDKDQMCAKGMTLGLRGESLTMFLYACLEVKLTLNVDMKTGKAIIIAVDDKRLKNAKG